MPFYSLFVISALIFVLEINFLANAEPKKFAPPMRPQVSQRQQRLNAKRYMGFVDLEAALIPIGTYLQLNQLSLTHGMHSFTASGRPAPTVDESTIMNDMISSVISEQTETPVMSMAHRKIRQEAAKRWLAGITPLRATRVPMGIFIPEGTVGNNHKTVRAKLSAGVRRIFQKLRKLSTKRDTFEYVQAFNGLTPLDAVFIPRGYFIPMSAVLSYNGGLQSIMAPASSNSTVASRPIPFGRRKRHVAGVEPLDSVLLPGGIFIPHRMTGLPTLPQHIGSSLSQPVDEIGVVNTLKPELESGTAPGEPNFPDDSTTTPAAQTTPTSAAVTPAQETVNIVPTAQPGPLDCSAGPNIVPGCSTFGPNGRPSRPQIKPTDAPVGDLNLPVIEPTTPASADVSLPTMAVATPVVAEITGLPTVATPAVTGEVGAATTISPTVATINQGMTPAASGISKPGPGLPEGAFM